VQTVTESDTAGHHDTQ